MASLSFRVVCPTLLTIFIWQQMFLNVFFTKLVLLQHYFLLCSSTNSTGGNFFANFFQPAYQWIINHVFFKFQPLIMKYNEIQYLSWNLMTFLARNLDTLLIRHLSGGGDALFPGNLSAPLTMGKKLKPCFVCVLMEIYFFYTVSFF